MRRVALFAALAACPAGLAADDSDGLSGSVELAFPQSGLAELTTDITARRGWALGQLDIEPTGDAGDTHELRLFAGVARDFENAQITFGLTVHALNQSGFQYYDLGASGEIALGDRATLYGGAAFAPQRNEVTTDLGLEVAFGEFSAFLELESTDFEAPEITTGVDMDLGNGWFLEPEVTLDTQSGDLSGEATLGYGWDSGAFAGVRVGQESGATPEIRGFIGMQF